MSNILSIENLNYKDILKNINISVEKNTFIAISGPNKCGKTTLIKALSKKIQINNSITINNQYIEDYNIRKLDELVGTVIYTDDNKFLFNTVEDELMFILDTTNMSKQDKMNRYKQIVKLFKLNKYQTVNPNELYKNLQIKLTMAKEIILKPQILLLDDICIGMTEEETKDIEAIIKYLIEDENMTIIMSTSNLGETIASNYLYILQEGEVVLEGKPIDILQKDNVLNRLGLELPFMIDLSVKLRDYDLIKELELDMDRMVNILWK